MRTLYLSMVVLCAISVQSFAQTHRDWSYNLGMYEVNVRQYSSAGTFEAFGERLDDLDSLGVGILWFMPIHPIGEENRLGSLGSYYSVKDYKAVNPEFGTMDDFKAVVDSAHAKGMYVIIDWVPNHTSWDNVLTETNPDWYAKNGSGNFMAPPGTGWSDVIQLDYSKQGLRDYMVEALKFWVDSANVDGFRFDAADMVPAAFWNQALPALKAHKPDIFLLGEVNNDEFFDYGMDMTYAWDLYGFGYGAFIDVASGSLNAPAARLSSYFSSEKSKYTHGEYRMYFTSNHDENSWYGTDYELFGNARYVFAVITATANGMPLIYSGQEAAMNIRLQFFEKDLIPWTRSHSFGRYRTLLNLKKRNSALWNGSVQNYMQRVLTTNNLDIFAFLRELDDDRVFVVTNVSDEAQSFNFTSDFYYGSYREVYTGEEVTFSGSDTLTLPAWGYAVYEGIDPLLAIEDVDSPLNFVLHQNYPNPFNPSTVISYQLPVSSHVRLKVYDLLGREVATLVDGIRSAGSHRINFEGGQLTSGMYMYRLETASGVLSRKLMLMK